MPDTAVLQAMKVAKRDEVKWREFEKVYMCVEEGYGRRNYETDRTTSTLSSISTHALLQPPSNAPMKVKYTYPPSTPPPPPTTYESQVHMPSYNPPPTHLWRLSTHTLPQPPLPLQRTYEGQVHMPSYNPPPPPLFQLTYESQVATAAQA